MAAKVTKESVGYRPASRGDSPRRCGTCVMFRKPNACTLVAGTIRPVFVCDRWSPKR